MCVTASTTAATRCASLAPCRPAPRFAPVPSCWRPIRWTAAACGSPIRLPSRSRDRSVRPASPRPCPSSTASRRNALLKREELTTERIEEIVADARKAGYDFFLSAEQREASLKEALARYKPGEEAWIFAYGSLMWNPAIEFAEPQPRLVEGGRPSVCFSVPLR